MESEELKLFKAILKQAKLYALMIDDQQMAEYIDILLSLF